MYLVNWKAEMQAQLSKNRHEVAEVISLDHDFALVVPLQQAGCGSCQAQTTCGTGILAKALGNKRQQIRLENSINAVVGDKVVVVVPERGLLIASSLIYLFPLITFFTIALIFNVFGLSESFQVIGGIAGLMSGFALAQIIAKLLNRKFLFSIRMVGFANENMTLHFERHLSDNKRSV